MCVTNTTHRRSQAVSLNPAQVQALPSVLSQRLLGSFASTLPAVAPKSVAVEVPTMSVSAEKARPKRRRKPQKPGKTAKMNDRHFVVHNYHDHANDVTEETQEEDQTQRRRGGVSVAFPLKLHAVLEQVEADGLSHVVSWQSHGRCFVIHQPKDFVSHVMPRYFRQTKLTSFQRQLNLYGFSRLTRGPDAGGYYHELFLRGKLHLCKKMTRTKVKGTRFKAASSPDQEPDFYKMAPVIISPHNSSDEEMSHHSNETHETFTHIPVYQQPPMMDPLPVQFEAPLPAPVAYQAFQLQQPTLQQPADKIFDEAVNELFLDDGAADFNVNDFVQDWDPNVNMEPVLQDDAQLGFLLEKLLED